VNSEGSSCKVIYEERFINIWRNARIFTSHMRKPVVIYDFAPSPLQIFHYFLTV
jgi:hypothetical protein